MGELLKNKEFANSIGSIWNYGSITDSNKALDTGLYVANSGATENMPTSDTCLIEVVATGNYAIQKAYALNSNDVYQRRILKYISKINGWVKIH